MGRGKLVSDALDIREMVIKFKGTVAFLQKEPVQAFMDGLAQSGRRTKWQSARWGSFSASYFIPTARVVEEGGIEYIESEHPALSVRMGISYENRLTWATI